MKRVKFLNIVPFLFTQGAELSTIVKILSVKVNVNEKAEPAIQVNLIACTRQYGNVFKLNCIFLPEGLEDQKIIVREITEGKIMTATALFFLTNDKGSVMLIDPQYSPLRQNTP